jgi:hypothetical protein
METKTTGVAFDGAPIWVANNLRNKVTKPKISNGDTGRRHHR